MRIDYSKEIVVIDDVVGGQREITLFRQLKKEGSLSGHYLLLDTSRIREAVLRKLKGKTYGLMLFVESGGTYLLGIPSIMAKGTKSLAVPVSSYTNGREFDAEKNLKKFERYIENYQRIALVEGDVGSGGHSIERLSGLKKEILRINPNAGVEVIVGVATKKAMVENMAYGRLFDIVGIIVEEFYKLSDYAIHEIETTRKFGRKVTPLQLKLLDYFHARKPHKVPLR